MLRYGLTVFEHDELVRNLHALINPTSPRRRRCPASAPTVQLPRDGLSHCPVNVLTVFATNCGSAFLPPNRHPCRLPVLNGEQGHSDPTVDAGWMEDALPRGAEFVCENLSDASNSSTFQRGRHASSVSSRSQPPTTTPSSRPWTYTGTDVLCGSSIATAKRTTEQSGAVIDACAVKNSVRPDLRLFIH